MILFHLPVHCTRKKLQVWSEGRAADLLDFLTKWLNTRRRALISPGTFKSQKQAGTSFYRSTDWTRRRSFCEKTRPRQISRTSHQVVRFVWVVCDEKLTLSHHGERTKEETVRKKLLWGKYGLALVGSHKNILSLLYSNVTCYKHTFKDEYRGSVLVAHLKEQV